MFIFNDKDYVVSSPVLVISRPPRSPGRLHPVVLVLPAVDAAPERVLAQVVPVHRGRRPAAPEPHVHVVLSPVGGVVVVVVDVVYDVPLLVGRRRGPFSPLPGLAFGARGPYFAHQFPDGLACKVTRRQVSRAGMLIARAHLCECVDRRWCKWPSSVTIPAMCAFQRRLIQRSVAAELPTCAGYGSSI